VKIEKIRGCQKPKGSKKGGRREKGLPRWGGAWGKKKVFKQESGGDDLQNGISRSCSGGPTLVIRRFKKTIKGKVEFGKGKKKSPRGGVVGDTKPKNCPFKQKRRLEELAKGGWGKKKRLGRERTNQKGEERNREVSGKSRGATLHPGEKRNVVRTRGSGQKQDLAEKMNKGRFQAEKDLKGCTKKKKKGSKEGKKVQGYGYEGN